MRRRLLAVTVLGVVLLAASGTQAAWGARQGDAGVSSTYVVAEVPFKTDTAGTHALATEVDVLLCTSATVDEFETCQLPGPLPQLAFSVDRASVGTTVWTDASSPNFGGIVGSLTNGRPEFIWRFAQVPFVSVGNVSPEQSFFAGQVGPSGVDLFGYAIRRVGFRVDALTLDSPGRDLQGDGIWTDFAVTGAFIFEGTIANSDACKNGGWQSLHGPGGTPFQNQGNCIQFANSVK
jgi:hypothetical protein